MTKPAKSAPSAQEEATVAAPKCGIVMPISALDACSEQHWSEVKTIISDAVEAAGFTASLVSDADDVGIIQKRIIQNLYDNPIVVCDVSGKNPNVMFELGMRLAFDKPTIIVKDDKTSYSFDTAPIEHIEYPRDLRFAKIVDFKKNLSEKILATVQKSSSDKDYTTFLKHFGKFTLPKLETTEISKEDYIIEELRDLRQFLLRRDLLTDREKVSQANRGDVDCSDEARFALRRRNKFIEHALNSAIADILKDDQDILKSYTEKEVPQIIREKVLEHPSVRGAIFTDSDLNRAVRNFFDR